MSEAKPAIASAVIVQDGRLLLARRREQEGTVLWALPGGGVEPGESVEEAAVRETLEETGLTVEARQLLGSRIHPATKRHMSYVACDVIAGTPHIGDPEEHDRVEFVRIGELSEYVPHGLFEPVQRFVDATLVR
jgi:8-oxo-dGTP diphosphatase